MEDKRIEASGGDEREQGASAPITRRSFLAAGGAAALWLTGCAAEPEAEAEPAGEEEPEEQAQEEAEEAEPEGQEASVEAPASYYGFLSAAPGCGLFALYGLDSSGVIQELALFDGQGNKTLSVPAGVAAVPTQFGPARITGLLGPNMPAEPPTGKLAVHEGGFSAVEWTSGKAPATGTATVYSAAGELLAAFEDVSDCAGGLLARTETISGFDGGGEVSLYTVEGAELARWRTSDPKAAVELTYLGHGWVRVDVASEGQAAVWDGNGQVLYNVKGLEGEGLATIDGFDDIDLRLRSSENPTIASDFPCFDSSGRALVGCRELDMLGAEWRLSWLSESGAVEVADVSTQGFYELAAGTPQAVADGVLLFWLGGSDYVATTSGSQWWTLSGDLVNYDLFYEGSSSHAHALRLKGGDGEQYVALVSATLEPIAEPVKGSFLTASEELIWIERAGSAVAYDASGAEVAATALNSGQTMQGYGPFTVLGDGGSFPVAATVFSGTGEKVLDTDGPHAAERALTADEVSQATRDLGA